MGIRGGDALTMRAVFLDRDGILNRAIVREGRPYPPASLAEFEILPEARDACAMLSARGFLLVCITNQPDIARGTADADQVAGINNILQAELGLHAVMVCPHDDADGCACRKPRPGLLLAAARARRIDLAASFMVGDRWRDIDAGRAAGCRTIWVDRGYAERTPVGADHVTGSVRHAADWIAQQADAIAPQPISADHGP